MQYRKGLADYELQVATPRGQPTALHVYEGSAGTYKSFAATQWPNMYTLEQGNSGTWFDGYEPNKHDTVVIDEFHGGFMPYTTLKKLCDRYPMTVETKGGRVLFKAKRVVITSNILMEQWYPKYEFASIERRITSRFRHVVTEAPLHGVPAGVTTVTRLAGTWHHHPLNACLYIPDPENAPDVARLDPDRLAEQLDTAPIDDPEELW